MVLRKRNSYHVLLSKNLDSYIAFLNFALVKPFHFLLAILLLLTSASRAQYVNVIDTGLVMWLSWNGYDDALDNYQLDTTHPLVLNTTELDMSQDPPLFFTTLHAIRYFDNLEVFKCIGVGLDTLTPHLPQGLKHLECYSNQLTFMPPLPASLEYLRCENNDLTSLSDLPQALEHLDCSNNLLTSLPNLPPALVELYCYQNELTSLRSLPANLYKLFCGINNLTALPPLPSSLRYLSASTNQLTWIPELPDTLASFNVGGNTGLTCLPPLEYLDGSTFYLEGTGVDCIPFIPSSSWPYYVDNRPICTLLNENGCDVGWNISGSTYLDNDNDCTHDSTEPMLKNVKLLLSQDGILQQQVYSKYNGFFSFNTNLGNYTVSVDTTGLPFAVSCPSGNLYATTLTASDSIDHDADLGFVNEFGYDLAVTSVTPGGLFFPGQLGSALIHVGDLTQYYGAPSNTSGLSGTVTAVFSGPVAFVEASTNGILTGNTVTWNVTDLSQLNFQNDFWIKFLSDTTAQFGQQVCLSITVTPNNDNNPANNALVHCFNVLNSYDPNCKDVYPTQVTTPGNWHTYTIQFQNTGWAPAINIIVKDTLSGYLDWTSFQLLGASHENITQVLPNGAVHFTFANIHLADSLSNEPESHGWIQYRIRTKTSLAFGIVIPNTASIYFDYNAPVVTNDAPITYQCVPLFTEQTMQLCSGDSLQVGNTWHAEAGTFTDALTSLFGCDSTVTTTLTFLQPTFGNQSLSICQGDSVQHNGVWYNAEGTYHQTLTGQLGCDSLLDVVVTLLLGSSSEQSVLLCDGDSLLVGSDWVSAAGTYVNILPASNGCDSTVTTIVDIETIDITIELTGDTLSATPDALAYQWFNCDNGQPVLNANTQTFVPTTNGTYAVELNYGDDCATTSACVNYTNLSVDPMDHGVFKIFPNPSSGRITVEHASGLTNTLILIRDVIGRNLVETPLSNGANTSVLLDKLMDGTYYVCVIRSDKTIAVRKLAVVYE